MKKITILSLFALMLFIVYGCGGGGLGLPGGSWDSGDGTTPVSTTTKIIEINGSFTAPAVPAPAGGPLFAADLSNGRYSLSIIDRDNPSREAGTMSAGAANAFHAVIKASAVNMHAMIVLTDKQSQRVLYRNLLGKVPKFSEIPSTVNKVVINGIAVNEISTARALFAIEKGLSDIAITAVSTSEVQSGGIVTKDFTGIKTDFDAAAENMAGGSANVTQLANAVQAVAAVLASTSVNESTKSIIAIDQIENATEMLTSFLNSLKNASAQQLIQANGLTQSVKIGDTSITSSTSQTAVNSAVSGVIPIAPAAAPVFQPAGGSYTQDVSVTITTATPGAIIRYTIDGSVPGAGAGNIYSGPIAVSNTTNIKAVAIKSGYSDSPVVSAAYTLPLKAATPVISPGEGTYTSAQSITIVSSTAGAAIKYTIDGTNPSETNGTAYTGAFAINATTTIKAIAIMSGMANSNITTASFVINTEKAATPVFSPAAGTYSAAQSVTLSTATAGASIKYTTDGSAPSATNGLTYSGAISVTATTTIKAVAVKTGLANSDTASAAYTIQETVSAPIFNPPAGSYETAQSVSIISATSGASVFFTTNGSTPTLLSSQYTSTVSIASSATIKAIAIKTGMAASSVSSAAYTILQKVSAPSFNPAAGSYEGTQSVAITSATSGTSIYYTLDGSTPSAASSAYTSAVSVASNITLKAIAVKTGMSNSDVSQASYTITFPPAADPVFSVANGTYNDTQSVTITSTTSGAAIYYTLDNTNPTSASYLYTSAVSIGKTAFIKAIAVKAGMTSSNISIASYVIDRLAPSFTIQYYSDSALSLSLGDTPRLSAGTYYMKIISTKELRSAPTITIGAEGSANDVSGAATVLFSEYTYKYTRTIASDSSAAGSVIEDISISATDIAGNVATSINPSNESTKAAYTDTIAPTAAITYAPSSTVKQGAAITVNAVISESLMSTPALKLAISGANTITATDMTRTDATHYTYSHTADAGGGSATIALSGAKDLAGNLITAAPSSGAAFTIDNTTLAAGTYKKVGTAPTTTVNDAFISGDTLTVGAAAGAVNYNVAANTTIKSIMGQLANNNTFTIDSNGKVSAIDASIATGTPSIALTASQCASDLSVKGFADAALTLTGSAASQAINLNVTGGTVVASDANLTGTVTMNTAAAATISTGAKAVTVGATAAASAVGITATGGSVAIDAAASAVSINGIKVDPSVTTTITVTDANTLEAAGGATTYTLDATTTAAKTFNFTTAAQTGAIAAKASEETNGLVITSATAASTGVITVTGGKVNVSSANLTGNISYNANATATILSGAKALTIGASAAANAVSVTATGGSVSVDAAASAVTINGIKIDPDATTVITVNGANELSAAGGATNYTIDATTTTAKIFNFITTGQTGTISAKASEAVNGLTITAAVASNGPITITGGKVDVSNAGLTGSVTYNTAAAASILSGTKTVNIGAAAAANAVGITATGGIISVDTAATAVSVSIGTGNTVKINDISVTPSAAVSITVNGLNELSAAGGATNYTIDATTTTAKIFNFITTGQTGTISAKASEAVNGLTLAAAVASNGVITITGGKINASDPELTGAINYDTNATATILSGAKALTIGATAAANAVSVTATGGSVSVNAAASAVTINEIKVDPDATTVITVNGANELSAAGGATNYTIDATTTTAKIFNFITTGQTGTISAKASEAVNGLTITAAVASNGAITVTGGKVNVSNAGLTGSVTYNTAAAATILSGTKTVNIGAAAAANAVGITATGGIISVDTAATAVSVSIGTGNTVKVNDISVTPSAAVSITVNGLNELSAAGGATNYTIDATTTTAKIFNFITTGQTGTISAKASEAVNGLTLAAAVASNGVITITGGKINASDPELTGAINYDTNATATILSGAKALTIGATAAANAVSVTATGGSVSVDAAASNVTVNGIKIDPNATTVITVNGANELSAAGGATNFALTADTTTAKIFNFTGATAQTGTISATASEDINGLTLTAAAAASTGVITANGGKIIFNAANGNFSGTQTIANSATAVIGGITLTGAGSTVQQTGAAAFTIGGSASTVTSTAAVVETISINAAANNTAVNAAGINALDSLIIIKGAVTVPAALAASVNPASAGDVTIVGTANTTGLLTIGGAGANLILGGVTVSGTGATVQQTAANTLTVGGSASTVTSTAAVVETISINAAANNTAVNAAGINALDSLIIIKGAVTVPAALNASVNPAVAGNVTIVGTANTTGLLTIGGAGANLILGGVTVSGTGATVQQTAANTLTVGGSASTVTSTAAVVETISINATANNTAVNAAGINALDSLTIIKGTVTVPAALNASVNPAVADNVTIVGTANTTGLLTIGGAGANLIIGGVTVAGAGATVQQTAAAALTVGGANPGIAIGSSAGVNTTITLGADTSGIITNALATAKFVTGTYKITHVDGIYTSTNVSLDISGAGTGHSGTVAQIAKVKPASGNIVTITYPVAATGELSPLALPVDSAGAGFKYVNTYTVPYTSGSTTATHTHTANAAGQVILISVAANL